MTKQTHNQSCVAESSIPFDSSRLFATLAQIVTDSINYTSSTSSTSPVPVYTAVEAHSTPQNLRVR